MIASEPTPQRRVIYFPSARTEAIDYTDLLVPLMWDTSHPEDTHNGRVLLTGSDYPKQPTLPLKVSSVALAPNTKDTEPKANRLRFLTKIQN